MRYLAAIDQGTTSTRCIVFDAMGEIVAIDQLEHAQMTPRPGWVEHDAVQIWINTQAVIQGALARAELKASDVASLGITNQRETTVLWDRRTGKPVYPAIVWQDLRTADICAQLTASGAAAEITKRTGLPVATYFSGPKIRWILEHVPGARARAERGELLFGTMDSWLVWQLTGEHLTDVTNASRTLLMNIDTLKWDDELLTALDVPRSILPEIRPSIGIFGISRGHLDGVPVCAVLGDQQAALFGQCCFEPGDVKNTYGTGCFLLMNTGDIAARSQNGLLTTVAYQLSSQPPVYALEGSVAIAGAAVQWLRDNLGLISQASEIEALAASVPDNGDVYFVPAFSGLFAPHWRADARGMIIGLTRHSNKGHIARAVLEATAFQTWDVIEAMQRDASTQLWSIRVDGKMVENELLMQFQADMLGLPVVKPRTPETTALGAAYGAGIGSRLFTSLEELRQKWQKEKVWTPNSQAEERHNLIARWHQAVERSFGWVKTS
jgi:glycerol kinase